MIYRLLLALLFLAQAASAAEITDASDDATLQPVGAATPGSGADLRRLILTEDESGFTFALDAGALEDPSEGPLHTGTYRIHFTFNDAAYQLVWYRFVTLEPALEPSLRVTLRDGADQVLASLTYEVPFTVFVQRGQIIDGTGNIPALGATLSGIFVESRMAPSDVFSPNAVALTVEDRMPDEGAVDYAVAFGPVTVGPMRAVAQQAFRTSNGGAETFLYLVNVTGGGPAATIRVESVPNGWHVYAPSGTFNARNAVVPILVETAFFHQHGAIGSARLAITEGGNTARVDIGINYLNPSRPDGHHSTLVFHSARTTKDAINDGAETATGLNFARAVWFNTNEEDPSDEGVPVAAYSTTRDGISGYAWVATLSPALRDGIHFANGTGLIRVPISYPANSPGRLHGTLSWSVPGKDPEIVGTIEPTEPVQLNGATVELEGTVITQERRIDLAESGDLRLDLLLEAENIPNPYGPGSQPFWESGGIMQIPLYDYHPPVHDQLAETTNVRVTTPVQVKVIPGMPGILATQVSGSGQYALEVFGDLSEWATVSGNDVIITPPADVKVGAFGEIVVRASDIDDPLAWGIARTRIVVANESSLQPVPPNTKDSPSLPPITPLLVLLGTVWTRKLLQRGGQA